MAKLGTYAGVMFIAALSLAFVPTTSRIFDVLLGVTVGFAIPVIDALLVNATKPRLAWYSIRYGRRRVRVSVSYLYRISLCGSYLLVRGHRWPQYQPVGGVYKTTPAASPTLDEIGALNDDLVQPDELSEHDLRLRIPGRNLYRFYQWFDSGKDRETSPWREFYEELVKPGLLASAEFPYVYHRHIRRTVRPMRYSAVAQSTELLIADIYELIPTPEQLRSLEDLREKTDPAYLWATADEIRRRGARPGANQTDNIGGHTEWIL